MRSFTLKSVSIIIVLTIVYNSICSSNEITLPDADDINKYYMENSYRFNQKSSSYEKEFSADHITPLPYYNIFKSYSIFAVTSYSSRCLENMVVGFRSYGYFAFNGEDILYLNRTNIDNIESLFKNEKIRIDKVDAKFFCDFLCLTILKNRQNSYKVISSASDIIDQATTDHFSSTIKQDRPVNDILIDFSYGYEINKTEMEKIKISIQPPKISGNKIFGWKVEFYSWGGSLAKVTDVSRHVFKISGKYKIRHAEETLTTQIFSKVPTVMYD